MERSVFCRTSLSNSRKTSLGSLTGIDSFLLQGYVKWTVWFSELALLRALCTMSLSLAGTPSDVEVDPSCVPEIVLMCIVELVREVGQQIVEGSGAKRHLVTKRNIDASSSRHCKSVAGGLLRKPADRGA